MNVPQVATEYLETHKRLPEPVRCVLEVLRDKGTDGISTALDLESARSSMNDTTRFLLRAIDAALDDHVLTVEEINELRILKRVFRVEERDMVECHRSTVSELLCREAALIFEDQGVSAAEELQETRLQEVFGLGYDEFISILEPEVDRLVQAFDERLRAGTPDDWLGSDWREIRDRLNALSLTQYVHWIRNGGSSRAGYIYLLANPSMPGMMKVGRTSHPPSRRAAELTGATGVPTPFEVVFELHVSDQFAAEAYVHRALEEGGARVSDNREFFAVQPAQAMRLMLEARDRT